jgi:hypothetical protein
MRAPRIKRRDVRHPASIRYDRHSSRSCGASAFRGSFEIPKGFRGENEMNNGVLRNNKSANVAHKLDCHALRVEQVDAFYEELGQVGSLGLTEQETDPQR